MRESDAQDENTNENAQMHNWHLERSFQCVVSISCFLANPTLYTDYSQLNEN